MSERLDLLSYVEDGKESSFRINCLKLIQHHGVRQIYWDSRPWVANAGPFCMVWFDGGLLVHFNGDCIWSDFRYPSPWGPYQYRAIEYETMLDQLMILDRLANV